MNIIKFSNYLLDTGLSSIIVSIDVGVGNTILCLFFNKYNAMNDKGSSGLSISNN